VQSSSTVIAFVARDFAEQAPRESFEAECGWLMVDADVTLEQHGIGVIR
jgi:hypothetical protein